MCIRSQVAGTEVEIGAVSMGNPHAVLTVSSVASAPVDRLGPAIEKHPRFPRRVNVGFMEIIDRSPHPPARVSSVVPAKRWPVARAPARLSR